MVPSSTRAEQVNCADSDPKSNPELEGLLLQTEAPRQVFVIQVFRTDSVRTDAVAAIVINVTILASGLYICYEVAVRARVLWRRS